MAPAAAPTAAPEHAVKGPSPIASPGDGKAEAAGDFPDLKDFEWDLADEAEGTDFEIDASATSFFMPRGNLVVFKAKALNGTPPFTFSWDFGDGSPHETGEVVKHQYNTLGSLEVTAKGTDASGASSFMQLQILVIHPVEFAIKYQQDEKTIEELKKANPDWQEHIPPAPIASP